MTSSTSSASGLLNRNIIVATGVSAVAAPAISPACGEKCRRTSAETRATVITPMIASGSRMLNEESPKIRTDSAITHSDAGGLSTVIEFPASEEP